MAFNLNLLLAICFRVFQTLIFFDLISVVE